MFSVSYTPALETFFRKQWSWFCC